VSRKPILLAGIAVWVALAASPSDRLAAMAPSAGQAASSASQGSASARALLDSYCVSCHNEKLKTGGVVLDTADVSNVGQQAETWEKVVRKLRAGTMPPPGRPRPAQPATAEFVSWLESSLDRVAAANPDPGRTALHRLNRTEYTNAVRDLLALEIDARALLPADDTDEHGFDNVAEVLTVSPALMERYLFAARRIARLALGYPTGPGVELYQVPRMLTQDDRLSEDLPFGSRGGAAIKHYFPADGQYTIKVRLKSNLYDYILGLGHPHQLEVRLDGVLVKRFTVGGRRDVNPPPPSFSGAMRGNDTFETYAHEADLGLETTVAARAGMRTLGVFFVRTHWEPEGVLQPIQTGYPLAVNEQFDGNLALDSVAIDGPHKTSGPGDTPSRQRILVCRPSSANAGATSARALQEGEACARRILTTLARRAYRRPVADDDVQTLMGFYRAGREEASQEAKNDASQAASFDAGIQFALERILIDPDFLFRAERDPSSVAKGSSYRLTDLELASRLSFFLWSSIPDDELLDSAARGRLRDPETLARQLRRMLADKRSNALVENFAGQWLMLRNIRDAAPDPDLFPDFDENLREGFRRETELFIESQIRDDRSVLELLSANYTFLNERLARHYQIPNVLGTRFRRVTLPDARRGGLLGHGSLLTVTSYPNRTSPVLRGKWLLENILGTPPPPPPPDVPALKDRGENGRPQSVRERLESHRQNPTCAACHAQMDPLGFALDHFDAVGKWRTADAGTAVDATGELPDGTRFGGLEGLRTLLLGRREQFVSTVTEKLLAYALGRAVEHYDLPAVRKIVRDAARSDYHWSAVILGIVNSVPFQMRRAES
jgi:mono/diheme cytochrome c family protein